MVSPISKWTIEQTDPSQFPKGMLPTMYDLPSQDPEESGLPDEFHDLQPQLLSRTLRLVHYPSDRCFTDTERERLAKEQAQAQLLQAARNLLLSGLKVNQVTEMLGLSKTQVESLGDSTY